MSKQNKRRNRTYDGGKHIARLTFALTIAAFFIAGPARAQTADLGQVLHEVEAHAPALKAAYANTDVFKSKRKVVRSQFLGEIDIFGHDLHFNDNRLTRPIAPPINFPALTFDDNQIGYGVNARLPWTSTGGYGTAFTR